MPCSENTFLYVPRVFSFIGLTCVFVDCFEVAVKSNTANNFIERFDSWMRLCKLSTFRLKVHFWVERRGTCLSFSVWEAERGRFLWLGGQFGLYSSSRLVREAQWDSVSKNSRKSIHLHIPKIMKRDAGDLQQPYEIYCSLNRKYKDSTFEKGY